MNAMSGACMYNAQGYLVCDGGGAAEKRKVKERFEADGATEITIPSGTYTNKCKNCSLIDGVLTCTCKNNRGNYSKISNIEMSKCVNKDINTDYHGVLLCNLPKGSYLQSCTSCVIDNNDLSCMCVNPYRKYINSKLNIKQCQGDITSQDGVLKCNTE